MPDSITIAGIPGRPICIGGIGLFCSAGIGEAARSGGVPGRVPGFRARDFIPERKSIKLMSRAVQLGVSAAGLAAQLDGSRESFSPSVRGMYVGTRAQSGDPADLQRALDSSWNDAGQFSLSRFAQEGIDRIHPLWLVKGLSNNVLGLTSSALDIQGVNSNYCHGEDGGWTAIVEGARAVAEGRADWVLAGGCDALVGAEALLGASDCGEGAAFVVIRPGAPGGDSISLDKSALESDVEKLGFLGAATWPVALARKLHQLKDRE